MNISNLASLVRDDITTIGVKHDDTSMVYTYKCLQSLADRLSIGDHVIVSCTRGIKIAAVAALHDEPKIDIDSGKTIKWAFQRLDKEHLAELERQDRVIAEALRNRKRVSARQQALAALGITDAGELQALLGKPS